MYTSDDIYLKLLEDFNLFQSKLFLTYPCLMHSVFNIIIVNFFISFTFDLWRLDYFYKLLMWFNIMCVCIKHDFIIYYFSLCSLNQIIFKSLKDHLTLLHNSTVFIMKKQQAIKNWARICSLCANMISATNDLLEK